MGFRGALDLEDLRQRLVAAARLGVAGVERIAVLVDQVEGLAVREIRVVRDREYGNASVPLAIESLPQTAGSGRIGRAERLVRCATTAVDHVAVQVAAAAREARPLVGDEGGESAGIVVLLGCVDGRTPGLRRDMGDLVRNAVTPETLGVELGDSLEVRVADAPDELVSSPSDITIVAGIADEIVIVSGISDDVV